MMADEAHRSQYDFIDGFARHMRDALPYAPFIGFTGRPIEKTDVDPVFFAWRSATFSPSLSAQPATMNARFSTCRLTP